MSSSLHLLNKLKFLSAKRRLELFPPFYLMRIKVVAIGDDWSMLRIRLPLNWASTNAAGNMYGGYQASLADPIPALACLKKFPGYRVATKKLDIHFIRVGNSDLTLSFDFDKEVEQIIRKELEEYGRSTPCFNMQFIRNDGKVCTEIKNSVAIRPEGYLSHHE